MKELQKKCKEVQVVNDHVRLIIDDMMDTLHQIEIGTALAVSATRI